MFDEKEAPKLLFHKETGLLLVGGTPYQTEVVDNMIRRIRDDLKKRWSEERSVKQQSAAQARRVALARLELQLAEKELIMAEEQAERIRQRVSQGQESTEQLAQARMNVDRAAAMAARRKIELEAASESVSDEAASGDPTTVIYNFSDLYVGDNAGAVRGRCSAP